MAKFGAQNIPKAHMLSMSKYGLPDLIVLGFGDNISYMIQGQKFSLLIQAENQKSGVYKKLNNLYKRINEIIYSDIENLQNN